MFKHMSITKDNKMGKYKRCIQKEVESPHLILIMRNQVDNNPDQKVNHIKILQITKLIIITITRLITTPFSPHKWQIP